jgi:amidohydrolase|tara:strand:+ start:10658 stop:11827 length:1170 start_codon:yes stop_codon:yes gene_type:complete
MIDKWLETNFQKIVEVRRWLHQHPEVGFNEHETTRYCQNLMGELGLDIYQNKAMKTGFYCDYGSGNGPTIAVRCDLDALPIQEINQVDYCSLNPGVSHACGHDSHLANILGLATYIVESKIHIPGKVRFLFQPAEEIAPGGAVIMIDAGAIKGVDHIIGGHILPSLSPDKIGIKYGSMAAAVEQIDVTLSGPGGHTSRPAESVDLIWAQSHLVISLEESLKHHLDQRESVVLAFGSVEGGYTCNVLPNEIKMKGTLRYLNAELESKLTKIIDNTIHAVEQLTGAKITWSIPYTAPGLINDDKCTDLIIKAANAILGEENVMIMAESSMGGEDFAYYLEKIPGAYFRIGCNDGKTRDIHTNDFNLDEQCMATAIKVFSESISHYFQSDKN